MDDYDVFFNKNIGHDQYDKIYYSYLVHKYLCMKEKHIKDEGIYGEGLRYGKYAIVNAVSRYISDKNFDKTEDTLYSITDKILNKWVEFEKLQSKKESNRKYFYEKKEIISENNMNGKKNENKIIKKYIEDYDNYYKGSTLNNDLKNYDFAIKLK